MDNYKLHITNYQLNRPLSSWRKLRLRGRFAVCKFTFCRRGRAAVSTAYAVRSGKTEQVKSGVHIDAGMRIPYY